MEAGKRHFGAGAGSMQEPLSGYFEEQLGAMIVEGQRWEVMVRSEPDDGGTWHNALLFRRDGRASPRESLITGVEWHVPPGIALMRAQELGEEEQIALFRRALRPRPPVA
jgi:hypothetical protein